MSKSSIRDATYPTIFKSVLGVSLLTLLTLPVNAQQPAVPGTNAPGEASRNSAPRTSGSGNNMQQANGSRMVEADREMMEDLAQANLAEIATAKLALEKSKDAKITKFAQQMIDDHTKALEDLKKVARAKGVEIPSEPDFAHKAMSTAMMATTGDFFDKQYIQHAGVGDHRRTVDLVKKVQREAKDAGLKAYAGKVLPVVQGHLTMARTLNQTQ